MYGVPIMYLAALVAPVAQWFHPNVHRRRRHAARNRQLAQRRKKAASQPQPQQRVKVQVVYVPVARATVKITELPH